MKKLMINSMVLLTVANLTTSFANPFCEKNESVFHCKTKSDKHISVCKQGNHFTYNYGAKNKVEKSIKKTDSEVIKTPWNGYGSEVNQSIGFKYGLYTYSVFSSYDRQVDGKPTELADADITVVSSGGVLVEKNDSPVTTVNCESETMKDNIEDAITTDSKTPKNTAKNTPETKIDVASLFKGELLTELLEGEMAGMKGYDSILHTMYDVDGDADKDLFMQVIFKRGDVTLDAMVFYYNNALPTIDSNFKTGFSADSYHKLGQQGGDPRPCDICTFVKAEGDIFTFTDNSVRVNQNNAKPAPLVFKFTSEEGIGIEWEKQ